MQPNPAPLGEFVDVDGNTWKAHLVTGERIVGGLRTTEPLVRLTCPSRVGTCDYQLAQFLSVTGRLGRFRITGGELGDPIFTLPAGVANDIGQQALGRVDGTAGHYELRWVPADPSIPF